MTYQETVLAQRVKAMTRKEILLKAIEGKITWLQAADIVGISARQMRRMKSAYERLGFGGLRDHRGGQLRRKRIPMATVEKVLTLYRVHYFDFSVAHFHDFLMEKHAIKLSETWTRRILQDAKLVEKAPARGKHRRQRERRPMRGMLLHMDASTHAWIEGIAKQDLMVVMDDADGHILFAAFVPQEGTMPTLQALYAVLKRFGRFCELYTDRGAHFCTTTHAGMGPDELQNAQVGRALRALGIRHILARSPQARGRSERAFSTLQGRLPQELRLAGIRDYDAANTFLSSTFISRFNERFGVVPQQPESAFTPLLQLNIDMTLSLQHERVVRSDNTISFQKIILQLPKSTARLHFVRCPVTVHEFTDGMLGISYQGQLLARYDRDGQELNISALTIKTKQVA
jgi:hypothetical protein